VQSKPLEKQKKPEELGEVKYKCPICKDTEFIFYKDENGYDYGRPCECRERNAWKRRFNQSMIPDEFLSAKLENYDTTHEIQRKMYEMTVKYLNLFTNKQIPKQNFGLIAVFGEQRMKELPVAERSAIKQVHNNYGIGKTHLQIGLAKKLIKEGYKVLVVSDVLFMDELMNSKKMDDEGETYNKLLSSAISADILIWDDIGKVNWTEARERMYYTIINERYRKQKPIVFNSNEDRGTLADKIGYAAADRLIGQCEDYLVEAEGESWRLKKGNAISSNAS